MAKANRQIPRPLRTIGLTGICALLAGCGSDRGPRETLEARFARADKVLLMSPYPLSVDTTVRSVRLDVGTLATHQLYLKPGTDDDNDAYIHINSEGAVVRDGLLVGTLTSHAELLVTPGDQTLFVDDVPVAKDISGWDVYWVSDTELPPDVRGEGLPPMRVADSFMRHELEDGNCRVAAGSVKLSQRGGGMPRDAREARNPGHQRAVNPFSVLGSDNAVLSYDKESAAWTDYRAEARFYFGVPKTNRVVDLDTRPTNTDMLVVQGAHGHNQVAFGWRGSEEGFVLMSRRPNGDWTIHERMRDSRPPLTNWMKIGIEVVSGHQVRAFLDDVLVFTRNLDARIGGGFHIHTGSGPAEFDDIQAWSVPRPASKGTPLYVESRNFSNKEKSDKSDPDQFGQWAESSAVFTRVRANTDSGARRTAIVTALPLRGDFLYESEPHAGGVLPLPKGEYEFALYAATDRGDTPDIQLAEPLFKLHATRDDANWIVHGLPDDVWPQGHREATLRFRRQADSDNRIALRVDKGWSSISGPVTGALHISVARLHAADSYVFYPKPRHHMVYCPNVFNEMFEQAPSDWSWVEGAFRMDCRWACNDAWNFMACASPGVPWMSSKRTFWGDQSHEYYVSLRAAFPSDAGDTSFRFNSEEDRRNGFVRMAKNWGWYNRRDLNFSFCTDGRNPSSGYAVVFGGSDNTETRLLRKGKVVATTREPQFLFSRDDSYLAIHWRWWRFVVTKTGNQVRITLNDKQLFDYVDGDPLDGGHAGFWTVRNGFALARVTSSADRLSWAPRVLYVQDDEPGPWHPLPRDSAVLTHEPDTDLLRATATTGAGFHALRYSPSEPIDLEATPVMHLPLQLEPETAVNLHLFVGGESYLVEISAPVAGMKSLLTPAYERGECFRVPVLTESDVSNHCLGRTQALRGMLRIYLREHLERMPSAPEELSLTSMALGNTSNTGYLLAGSDDGKANNAGLLLRVGIPTFSSD